MKTKVESWECVCERCGNTWQSRTSAVPKMCPGCKSQKWDAQGPEITRKIEQEGLERKTEPPDREIIPFEDV